MFKKTVNILLHKEIFFFPIGISICWCIFKADTNLILEILELQIIRKGLNFQKSK